MKTLTSLIAANNRIFIVALLLVAVYGCKRSNDTYFASGNFETTEVVVSSEANGKILNLDIEEGNSILENQAVGFIDSVQLYLKMKQLQASSKALLKRKPVLSKQIAALEQQITTAKTEKSRMLNLVKANAANQKQLDDINAQISFLEKQLIAQKSTIETTNEGISGDDAALQIQVEQLKDQLHKCRIESPIAGVVLTKYVERGELAVAGKPLFKVADMSNMILRVYITSDQLAQLKIGQQVDVTTDAPNNRDKPYKGVVSWISSKAEFTPKTIATRNERANMVYGVKVLVKNDGYLKIGMYGNIKL